MTFQFFSTVIEDVHMLIYSASKSLLAGTFGICVVEIESLRCVYDPMRLLDGLAKPVEWTRKPTSSESVCRRA